MNKPERTQKMILECAREEFLQNGYEGASMRKVAAKAGMTTGAIYRYYADKDALFSAIVSPAANELYNRFTAMQEDFKKLTPQQKLAYMHEYSPDMLFELLDYVYEHFDLFKLLLCCAEGSSYAGYTDRLVAIEEQGTDDFIQALREAGTDIPPIPQNLRHILASAYFTAVFETVVHDMPKEEADEYVTGLTKFFGAGWNAVLGM